MRRRRHWYGRVEPDGVMIVPVGQKERHDCERMHAVVAQVEGRIGNNATELRSVMDTARDREGMRALRGLHDLSVSHAFPLFPIVRCC
jgi:hypothetical protein